MHAHGDHTMYALIEGCYEYMYAERHLRPKTISGYREALRFFAKQMDDPKVSELTVANFISFKGKIYKTFSALLEFYCRLSKI